MKLCRHFLWASLGSHLSAVRQMLSVISFCAVILILAKLDIFGFPVASQCGVCRDFSLNHNETWTPVLQKPKERILAFAATFSRYGKQLSGHANGLSLATDWILCNTENICPGDYCNY